MNLAALAGAGAGAAAAPSARAGVEEEFGKAIGITVVLKNVRTWKRENVTYGTSVTEEVKRRGLEGKSKFFLSKNFLTKDGFIEPPVHGQEEILNILVESSSLNVCLIELWNLMIERT